MIKNRNDTDVKLFLELQVNLGQKIGFSSLFFFLILLLLLSSATLVLRHLKLALYPDLPSYTQTFKHNYFLPFKKQEGLVDFVM